MLVLYRALLRLCPRQIRDENGAEMAALFAECVARERVRRGAWGGRLSSLRGFADLLMFAACARAERIRARPLKSPRQTRRLAVIVHDVRGALRLMRAQPALSFTIIMMLALGVGASTSIFSVVYGVLLKPLPFPEPDRIVQVSGTRLDRGWRTVSLTEANFWDLHDRNRTLEDFGILSFTSFSMTGVGEPERLSGGEVTTGFFRSLGVRPVVGRLFEKGEDLPGRGDGLVMLGHRLWMERFGGDASIVGRSVTLDNRPYSVIGVLPPGSPMLDWAQVFVPFVRRPNPDRSSFEYTGVARLKPGVTFDVAQADLSSIAKSLEASTPPRTLVSAPRSNLRAHGSPPTSSVARCGFCLVIPALRTVVNSVDPNLPVSNIRTLDEVVTASVATRRLTMWLLATFAALALVLALAGVYGVLAYSVARRTSEIGVRLALGAEHRVVLRSVVAAGMRPVVMGAAIGLGAAIWLSRLMSSLLFEVQPHDPATYVAAGLTVTLVALLACYAPARRVLRVDPATALRVE